MSLKLKNLIYVQEKENFEGKKENTLIINCNHCPDKDNMDIDYEKCYNCFLQNFYSNRHHEISTITIRKFQSTLSGETIKKYLEYFKIINRLKKNWRKIESLKKKYCLYDDFQCKLYNKNESLLSISQNDFFNPLLCYFSIRKKFERMESNDPIDIACKRCSDKICKVLKNLLEEFNNLDIIDDLKDLMTQNKDLNKLKLFYRRFLGIYEETINKDLYAYLKHSNQNKLIDVYKFGENGIFTVHVFEIPFELEKKYSIKSSIDRVANENYQNKLLLEVASNIQIKAIERSLSLEALMEVYKAKAIAFINNKYSFNQSKTEKIAFLSTLRKLNLLKLFPLLIDDYIEEIFLDSPKDKIYINHHKYGRCRTDISFSNGEIDRIKTFLRLYSGRRLDYSNPSLKYVLKNKYFYCRFTVDIDPIHSNKFGMDIRKLNKNIFTIQDLLKMGTLNPDMAGFLYFCILRRINITVTGETDTGKTTLINALDLISPKEYRKIYIEDITESLNQAEFQRHQVKFKVDSIESMFEKKYSKQNQIKNLLHRTPDIIYLGEILTKEEAEAMFHCLAAGLRGFQTIHSKSLSSLVNRFIYHFQINKSCLNDLDLIVFMQKSNNERKIISITEITVLEQENKLYNKLFSYNPEKLTWEQTSDLFKSNAINKLKTIENLTPNIFSNTITIYKEIFQFLLNHDKLTNRELIDLFDKINYHSFKSHNALNNFWKKWKKV